GELVQCEDQHSATRLQPATPAPTAQQGRPSCVQHPAALAHQFPQPRAKLREDQRLNLINQLSSYPQRHRSPHIRKPNHQVVDPERLQLYLHHLLDTCLQREHGAPPFLADSVWCLMLFLFSNVNERLRYQIFCRTPPVHASTPTSGPE